MNIKRSSWHYKLRYLGETESWCETLCEYFWGLVLKILLLILIPALPTVFIYLYLSDPEVAFAINILLLITVATALSAFVIHFLRKKLGGPPKLPKENIIKEYFRAKKDGLCPLIKFVD